MKDISSAQIQALLATLPTLSSEEQESLLDDLDALEKQTSLKLARDDFLAFCHRVYPGFKEGPHHRFLKPILHKVLTGEEDRLTVSMPPRFSKSETIAYLFVAFFLGHHPWAHIIMVTHTADLSATFGRKIRDLIDSPVYAEIFPDTVVSRDKAAAANWLTTQGGKYLAIGIGANVAGHGAHLLIADDLVSENAMLANPKAAFEMAFEYTQIGPLQRLMPGGRVIMIGTRWGALDPIGKVLQWAVDNPLSSQWTEIRFPAILPSGKSLWPEQWPIDQLLAKKASLMPQQWSAQYQQEPTAEEGALIKREWWKIWEKEDPPDVEYVIQAWDTAHEAKTKADYSACVTMGVWFTEDRESRVIILNAVRGQWEFPELKLRVMEQWKEWQPDTLIVEKKAAGAPLIQELNRMNIVVSSVSPSRKGLGVSNDKYARMNALSDIFSSGMVYIPDKRWAWELVDEVAAFPFGANDDRCFVANTKIILASGREIDILQLRKGDFVATPAGACEVEYCVCSDPAAAVVEVRFSNGAVLVGTEDHPIYSPGSGAFIPLGELTTGENVWALTNKLKSFPIAELTIAGIRTAKTKQPPRISTESALEKTKRCTAECGKIRTGRFLQDCMYTTKTLIQATMLWATWRPLPAKSTVTATACPALRQKRSINGNGHAQTHEQQESSSQQRMSAQAAGAFSRLYRRIVQSFAQQSVTTPFMQRVQERISVLYAQSSLFLRQLQWFARQSAGLCISGSGKRPVTNYGTPQEPKKHMLKRAPSAGKASQPPLRGSAYVPMSALLSESELPYVLGVRKLEQRQPVYAVKVKNNPVFFANGVLVHNCDCVQMCLARYRSGGFIRLPSDYQDEDEDAFKTRQRAYYG